MHSLTQISHQLKITKPALMARIRKIPNFRNKYCMRKGNKLFINEQGLKLISQPKHNSTSKLMKTRKGNSSHHLNRAQLLTIIKQLKHKNLLLTKTTYSQQQTIRKQQKTKKPKQLSNHHKHEDIISESFDEGVARKEIRLYKKHGPFYRFFHNIEKI